MSFGVCPFDRPRFGERRIVINRRSMHLGQQLPHGLLDIGHRHMRPAVDTAAAMMQRGMFASLHTGFLLDRLFEKGAECGGVLESVACHPGIEHGLVCHPSTVVGEIIAEHMSGSRQQAVVLLPVQRGERVLVAAGKTRRKGGVWRGKDNGHEYPPPDERWASCRDVDGNGIQRRVVY